ncbi:MAG TPA: methyl-accepting chemotaxis protein [Chloroflexia bacterium]|nr:methyl-accepting chemotaxis protein [Chloroflexia bacterium]
MVEWLIQCRNADPEQVRKGRSLSRLLLTFLVLAVALTLNNLFSPQAQFLLIDGASAVIVIGIYLLNRRGYVAAASSVLLTLISASIILEAVSFKGGSALEWAYPAVFVVVIAAAGVFLSWPAIVIGILIATAFTSWYYYASDIPLLRTYRLTDSAGTDTIVVTMIMVFVAVGALSWLSNSLIGETLRDLRRRAADLQTAYTALTAQTQREHHVGANIGALAAQLAAVSTRQATGVATQAESIGYIASTVAELHATADQITAVAAQVSGVADTALHNVDRAQGLVMQSREAVTRNRTQVHIVIERMTTLERLAGRITGFVNSIRALSDETQLLALNATIEAAGAGERGRRFNVVAMQVQQLSVRSNQIVDQIRAVIGELHEASRVALDATQQSIAVANEVEALADEVRQAQEQVVGAVHRTNELIHQISTATNQQTQATQQVTHTMQAIAQVADTTTQDTAALEGAIQELTQAAELLESTMTRLRNPLLAGSQPLIWEPAPA